MRMFCRRSTWFLASLALSAAACGTTEDPPGTGGAGGTGPVGACKVVDDCVAEFPFCRKVTGCVDGECLFQDTAEGTPLATQVVGDCRAIVCDGLGATKEIPVSDDLPNDGKACTVEACDGIEVVITKLESIPCYSGPEGTEGVGECKPGVVKCGAQGKPEGACEGEVLPTVEKCNGDVDADCDGTVGVTCVCGDGAISGDEQCDDGNTSDADPCSAVCQHQQILKVTSYGEHTCALLSGGVVKCWGAWGFGKLGLGTVSDNWGDEPGEMGANLPPVDLGVGAKAVAVSAGYNHTCAILEGGGVKCWGHNDYGQLGLGDKQARGESPDQMGDNLPFVDLGAGKKAVQLSLGFNHSCALFDTGEMKCWGSNFFGELGHGDTENRGDEPGEMGDNLPALQLGTGAKVKDLAAGGVHTCVVLEGGGLKCWGNGASGQLGTGSEVYLGDEPGEMGDALPLVDLGPQKLARGVAVGFQHSCAILEDDVVKCWGGGGAGQLGYGDTQSRGDEPGEMGVNLPGVDLGSGAPAELVTVGHTHSCALRKDGTVKCWGNNDFGQLGLGDALARGDGPGEMGDDLDPIPLGAGLSAIAITGGAAHTCARLQSGALKCWGYNNQGALGLGNGSNVGDAPNELGDALPTTKLFSSVW